MRRARSNTIRCMSVTATMLSIFCFVVVGQDSLEKDSSVKKFYNDKGFPIMVIEGRQTCYLYCLGENQKLALYYYCMATVLLPKPSPIPDTLPNKKIKNLDKMKPHPYGLVTGTDSMVDSGMLSKWYDASKADRGLNFTITPYRPINDTIKVIMLVGDTSSANGFRSHRCYWIFGYILWFNREYADQSILGYLDENKNKLSKNIVVWNVKPVVQ